MTKIKAEKLVAEFRRQDFTHIMLNNTRPDLKYRGYFPHRFNPSLSFSNIERESDANVMASVVPLGVPAPKLGRTFAYTVENDIPKIESARGLDEKGMFELRDLQQSLDTQIRAIRQNAIQNPDSTVTEVVEEQVSSLQALLTGEIYNDAIFTQNTIYNRIEWLAKRLASTGKIEIVKESNTKGAQGILLDFGVEVVDPSKDWADPTADPIKDIETIARIANQNGYNLRFMVTDNLTVGKILKLEAIKKYVFGLPINPSAGTMPGRVTLAQLNEALASEGLPTIMSWESYLVEEDKAGEKHAFNGWEQGRILFTDSAVLGNTFYTHSMEFFNTVDGGVMAKQVVDNMILSQMWGETDPAMLFAKASAFAIPSMNNTARKTILKAFTK